MNLIFAKKKKKKLYRLSFLQKMRLFLLSIQLSEKTIRFDNIRVSKKEFHKSKQSINLDLTIVDQVFYWLQRR